MDNELQRHEMVLEKTHESGAEEWFCPVCGRRFLMQWPPNYQRVILEPGDNYAIHSGGKMGLSMGTPQSGRKGDGIPSEMELPANEVDLPANEGDLTVNNEDLAPWMDWMEKSDFESLWADDAQ